MMTNRLIRYLLIPLGSLGILYLIVIGMLALHIKIVYQHTPSMPEGFYFIYDGNHYAEDDIVMIKPDQAVMQLILSRGYITKAMPLLKTVAASDGDYVCFHKHHVIINKKRYPLYELDKEGNKLPKINFCSHLKTGQYFVLGSGSERSFDSRYFGIINQEQILGRAIKL